MSLANVRTRIKTVLDGVAGIGVVRDYLRYSTDEAALAALYKTSGNRLHGWAITLGDGDPFTTVRHPSNHEKGTYRFAMHGWYAVDDANASEKTFANLVEAIIAAFRADKKLGNTVTDSGPAQWREGSYKQFAGVLCHYARIELAVTEHFEMT